MELPELPEKEKRVVIVGAGFAGLTLAKKLSKEYFQVILLDKNNYHQFQPLLYQVATAGLEPSSISFPLRKIFQHQQNIFIRIAEVTNVIEDKSIVETTIGNIHYDYLVLAQGAETNYFGMQDLKQHAFSMKSVSEALLLRNTLLQNYEQALITTNEEVKSALLNIVVVGGGPTGVELAGAIAEMKNKILPKDYPEINFNQMKIYLMEAAPRLLNGMSEKSAGDVYDYLHSLDVNVQTGTSVKNYDGHSVILSNGKILYTRCLIWAAGIMGSRMDGIPVHSIMQNKRVLVDENNKVLETANIYAIGDMAAMHLPAYPKGHPQVAQAAIQQAKNLAVNLKRLQLKKNLKSFVYHDKGSMATVGRNLAVAEFSKLQLKGFIAWILWMAVHLMSIIGIKNRLFILINWIWQYVTYDQSLRLIIRPSEKKYKINNNEKNNDPLLISKHFAGM